MKVEVTSLRIKNIYENKIAKTKPLPPDNCAVIQFSLVVVGEMVEK